MLFKSQFGKFIKFKTVSDLKEHERKLEKKALYINPEKEKGESEVMRPWKSVGTEESTRSEI